MTLKIILFSERTTEYRVGRLANEIRLSSASVMACIRWQRWIGGGAITRWSLSWGCTRGTRCRGRSGRSLGGQRREGPLLHTQSEFSRWPTLFGMLRIVTNLASIGTEHEDLGEFVDERNHFDVFKSSLKVLERLALKLPLIYNRFGFHKC